MLIVDADARVLTALRAAISSEPDLDVAGAVSGASAALTTAVESAPCVALVDVTVNRDGSGLTLVHLLSQIPGCRVVATSLRSGSRTPSHVAGAVAFVSKGEDVEAVTSAIRMAAAAT